MNEEQKNVIEKIKNRLTDEVNFSVIQKYKDDKVFYDEFMLTVQNLSESMNSSFKEKELYLEFSEDLRKEKDSVRVAIYTFPNIRYDDFPFFWQEFQGDEKMLGLGAFIFNDFFKKEYMIDKDGSPIILEKELEAKIRKENVIALNVRGNMFNSYHKEFFLKKENRSELEDLLNNLNELDNMVLPVDIYIKESLKRGVGYSLTNIDWQDESKDVVREALFIGLKSGAYNTVRVIEDKAPEMFGEPEVIDLIIKKLPKEFENMPYKYIKNQENMLKAIKGGVLSVMKFYDFEHSSSSEFTRKLVETCAEHINVAKICKDYENIKEKMAGKLKKGGSQLLMQKFANAPNPLGQYDFYKILRNRDVSEIVKAEYGNVNKDNMVEILEKDVNFFKVIATNWNAKEMKDDLLQEKEVEHVKQVFKPRKF